MNPNDALEIASEVGKVVQTTHGAFDLAAEAAKVVMIAPVLWAMVKRLERSFVMLAQRFDGLAAEVAQIKLTAAGDKTPTELKALTARYEEFRHDAIERDRDLSTRVASHDKQLIRVWSLIGNRPEDVQPAASGD